MKVVLWQVLGYQGRDFLKQNFYSFVKRTLRLFRRFFQSRLGSFLFFVLKFLCIYLKPNVFLTYQNTSKADGVGAQIQRIFAIRCLSASLNLGYVHTGVASLAIHPLDPYQSKSELEIFLLKLNHEFEMSNSHESSDINFHERQVVTLTFSFLFYCIFKSKFSRKQTLIRLVEPYPVSEYAPNLYENLIRFLPNFVLHQKKERIIAIHYRRGVGGFAIQRGESIPREMAGSYFSSMVKEIIARNQHLFFKVLVFTDSPTEDAIFIPPSDQSDLWVNSTRFSDGKMHVLGLNVQAVFKDVPADVEVFYGGDPLDVIKNLASAEHLILSRSSFGYVSALLNEKGKIYFPSLFWHAPKKSWHVINESDYI